MLDKNDDLPEWIRLVLKYVRKSKSFWWCFVI